MTTGDEERKGQSCFPTLWVPSSGTPALRPIGAVGGFLVPPVGSFQATWPFGGCAAECHRPAGAGRLGLRLLRCCVLGNSGERRGKNCRAGAADPAAHTGHWVFPGARSSHPQVPGRLCGMRTRPPCSPTPFEVHRKWATVQGASQSRAFSVFALLCKAMHGFYGKL